MATRSTPGWWYLFVGALVSGVLLGACLEPGSTVCSSGVVCPAGTACTASGTGCTRTTCGDGIKQPDEACDDGNLDGGDGCSPDCRSNEQCGNGTIDDAFGPGDPRNEACDDGNRLDQDGCSADCKSREVCGNRIVDRLVGEECDDGNRDGGDGCGPVCLLEFCGDNIVQPSEECDDGNMASGDGCSSTCKLEFCGDTVVQPPEVCDDGNRINGDGCSANCDSKETCGNGIIDNRFGAGDLRNELCDNGANNGDGGCSADCKSSLVCGNGIVDRATGEECDDGNRDAGDGCSAICHLERCGNAFVDVAAGEACDDGNRDGGDGCSADCRSSEACGNGILDLLPKVDGGLAEQCDDRNTLNGDGCSAACQYERCGNGVVDPGEQCDDRNGLNDDGCVACRFAFCGDGFAWTRDGGEQCDTGGASFSCNGNCTQARCGDGVVNSFRGEQCDVAGDGGAGLGGEGFGCNRDCTIAFCGDHKLNVTRGEKCDDGNTSNADECLNDCTLPTCGDGFVRSGVEQCDDGPKNTNACPYGAQRCQVCSTICQSLVLTNGTYCGDGLIQGAAGELCDDGNAVTETACPYGTPSCTGCNATCTQPIPNLHGPFCGDTFVQAGAGEACDLGPTPPTSCPYGTASCTLCVGCQTTTGSGPYCGDGATTDGEACDDANVSACGTCDATCRHIQLAAAAVGTLLAVSADRLGDAEYFVLDDGVHPAVAFEFDKDAPPAITLGRVRVDVTLLDDGGVRNADLVADSMVAAISATSSLNFMVQRGGGDGGVLLGNTVLGTSGNRPILDSVVDLGFQVTGMSRGVAQDCGRDVGCKVDADCLPSLSCLPAGASGRTCQ
jgi:cysteine-rich repeat protein